MNRCNKNGKINIKTCSKILVNNTHFMKNISLLFLSYLSNYKIKNNNN